MIHWCITIFFATIQISYIEQAIVWIFAIHLHMHQQTWKALSSILVLILLLFGPYARQFSKQTDKKNPY